MKNPPLNSPSEAELQQFVQLVAETLLTRGWRLSIAESCTGGWVAKLCTDLAGSSAWFEAGVVSYSNAAKQGFLGVSATTLAAHGAVSEPVVREMAEGMLSRSGSHLALAISGIAGPDGGSVDKPVGMVCFAWAEQGQLPTRVQTCHFEGDRDAVRRQAVAHALRGVIAGV